MTSPLERGLHRKHSFFPALPHASVSLSLLSFPLSFPRLSLLKLLKAP